VIQLNRHLMGTKKAGRKV